MDVAVNYDRNTLTLTKDFLLAFKQSTVVFKDLARFFSLLCVLLDALQEFLVLEGVLDELVLVELLFHGLDLLVAGVEDLLELADLLGVLLLCIILEVLISVAYCPIKALPSPI